MTDQQLVIGKAVKAKPGSELHAGRAIGRIGAYDFGPRLWQVEWDQGPPWRGWYETDELEAVPEDQP